MCNISKTNNSYKQKTAKPKQNETDSIQSEEIATLKSELILVKKALDEQQKLIKQSESSNKMKDELLEKKNLKIQSLKQTLGNSSRSILNFFKVSYSFDFF